MACGRVGLLRRWEVRSFGLETIQLRRYSAGVADVLTPIEFHLHIHLRISIPHWQSAATKGKLRGRRQMFRRWACRRRGCAGQTMIMASSPLHGRPFPSDLRDSEVRLAVVINGRSLVRKLGCGF